MIGRSSILATVALLVAGGASAAPLTPTSQRFILNFDMFAPADLSCFASGPGVRSYASRDLAGKPVLRITGHAAAADIRCTRPDGSHYQLTANQRTDYTAVGPTWGTVTFVRGKPAMTTVLRVSGRQDVYDFKSFVQLD